MEWGWGTHSFRDPFLVCKPPWKDCVSGKVAQLTGESQGDPVTAGNHLGELVFLPSIYTCQCFAAWLWLTMSGLQYAGWIRAIP